MNERQVPKPVPLAVLKRAAKRHDSLGCKARLALFWRRLKEAQKREDKKIHKLWMQVPRKTRLALQRYYADAYQEHKHRMNKTKSK